MYVQAPLLSQISTHLFLLCLWLFLDVLDQRFPGGFGNEARFVLLAKARSERRMIYEDILLYLIHSTQSAIALTRNNGRSKV